jgi:ABC-2 type transport system ATP-binding protein
MVGLDPRSARLLKDLLRSYADTGGTAMISTHTLELAEALCDRLAVIDRGRIVAEGTLDDLRRTAATDAVGLEEVFLRITRGATDDEIGRVIGA